MVGLLETHQVEVGTLTGIEQCELGKLDEQGFEMTSHLDGERRVVGTACVEVF